LIYKHKLCTNSLQASAHITSLRKSDGWPRVVPILVVRHLTSKLIYLYETDNLYVRHRFNIQNGVLCHFKSL